MTRTDIIQDIQQAILRLQEQGTWPAGPVPEIHVEATDNNTPGDFICVTPIDVAVFFHRHPSGVARELKEKLCGDYEQIHISHPGVLHFFVNAQQLAADVQLILDKGDRYGRTNSGRRQQIVVDCPSVNPAIPLTLTDARRLYTADGLARVLRETGHQVLFSVSWDDIGQHIDMLGESVARRWMQQSGINVPYEDRLYHGDYIKQLAREVDMEEYKSQNMKKIEWIKERMTTLALRRQKYHSEQTARHAMKVRVNKWYSDSEQLQVPERLRRVISVLGGGYHGHGYAERLQKAGVNEEVNIVRVHPRGVHLVMDGKPLELPQRPGEAVSISELTDEYGPDAVRLFFLQQSTEEDVQFDLNAAADESHSNPLVMIQDTVQWLQQYEHRAATARIPKSAEVVLRNQDEQELARELVAYPQLLDEISLSGEIGRLTQYVVGLSRMIWRLHFGMPDDDQHIDKERVTLFRASSITLQNALRVLGIDTTSS